MTGDLELTVVCAADSQVGYVAAFAETDQVLLAVGGTSNSGPLVAASHDAKRFVVRKPPRNLGLRDALVVGDAIWVCGEGGQLAMSRDAGASWTTFETGTEACLFSLALGSDGAVWCVGDLGYAARVRGDAPSRVETGTTVRLSAVYAVRDEIVILCSDGKLRRWADGNVREVSSGSTKPLTALAVTKSAWVVSGDGGFVARSPDGVWYSRAKTGVEVDLEGIVQLRDGRLVVVGDRGVMLLSADEGRTWSLVANTLGALHLWSVKRFGAGALIGGDDGFVARFGPLDDPHWADREAAGAELDDRDEDEGDENDRDAPIGADGCDLGRAVLEVEPAHRVQRDMPRAREAAAELERTPRAKWSELAWTRMEDGIAHRSLLASLDAEPAARAMIAMLDELRQMTDAQRDVALPALAVRLTPELEALLVGSLVRDDDLAGVLCVPAADLGAQLPTVVPEHDEDEVEEDNSEEASPGWDAIDEALAPLYDGVEPLHFGTGAPFTLGGPNPIHGISAYPRSEPVPHWHFVTYGFTDLFRKETEDPETSGFGFELTFRLARNATDKEVPVWALNFLQNLGRYVVNTGNRFAAGHKMGLNGPIALGQDTKITAICFADDPELGTIASPFGEARFVQVVGITDDEYTLIQEWSTTGLVGILATRLPVLVTELARASVLEDPQTAGEIDKRVAAEGSSEELSFAGDMKLGDMTLGTDDGRVRIELGALYAASLPRAMRGRIRHGRTYELRGKHSTLRLEPGGAVGYVRDGESLALHITQALAREIEVQLRDALAGTYDFEAWPSLEIVVTPSFIKAQDGLAIEVRGVADPDRAAQMIVAENQRLTSSIDDEADEADDDDGDDDEALDDHGDADAAAPDPARVLAALKMTERALRLAPDDSDVQFTHAMLLLDADAAELPGRIDELLARLVKFDAHNRMNVALRMGQRMHARFAEAVDVVVRDPRGYDAVAVELVDELAQEVIVHAPQRLDAFLPLLPSSMAVLSSVAHHAGMNGRRDVALAIYERMFMLTIPVDSDDRRHFLIALNAACVHAHALKRFAKAVEIADFAQPFAKENPYIYHASACAYAAVGDLERAFGQVKLAIEHEYDHLAQIETDADLGPILEWPEFKTLFHDWRARQEGN